MFYFVKSRCTCGKLYGIFLRLGSVCVVFNPRLCRDKKEHPGMGEWPGVSLFEIYVLRRVE